MRVVMRYLSLVFIFVGFSLTGFAQITEICNNGIDDDFDGFIDCYDGACANNSACAGLFLGNDATCVSPPAQFPKFTMALDFASPDQTTSHFARIVIGDYNRDGMPEIATMNRYTGVLYILNGNDGSVKYKNDTVKFEPYHEIATANIDNDNCAELYFIGYLPEVGYWTFKPSGKKDKWIVTQIEGVYMYAYDCQLRFLWRTKEPFPGGNDPINYGIADFDSDGLVEIYAKDEIYDAKTGVRLVKSTAADYSKINGGPVAINMTGDSRLELVIGLSIYQVNLNPSRTVDSGSLTLLKGRNDYFIRDEYNATSVADYNLDGFLDVIASGSTGSNGANTTVFFWDVQADQVKTFRDGSSSITVTLPLPPNTKTTYTASAYGANGWQNGTGRLNLGDLDGDGKMNASYVSGRYLYALKEDWTLLWRKDINEATSGYTGCTLFDFNGDGKAEIVYRDEQYLYIINGTDGTNFQNPQRCISRTNREYPVVADVDADGSTEICVTCGTNDANAWANFNTTSYSKYAQVRVYKSAVASEPWVPARRVWNQHGYFVVNINDDLTVPKIIQPHHTVWSVGSCTQGPNRPLNKFLNQSPYLNSKGCPSYAAPNITFSSIKPTIVPPQCPNTNYTVSLVITNLGDVSLTGNVPVSFYTSNPRKAGAIKLNTINVALNNLGTNQTVNVNNLAVNGLGSDSLYLVLNDAGNVPPPITLPNGNYFECDYTDNVFGAGVKPIPVKLTALETKTNERCSSPDNGAARAFVQVAGGGENTADYNFYWFKGATAKAIASADYVGAIYTGIPDGTYTVFARHKTSGCNSDTLNVNVGFVTTVPDIAVTVVSNQTTCNPTNGKLDALLTGGNAGFTFEWYDVALNPLGISGPTANNLPAGNYVVIASRNGCSKTSSPATIAGPQLPDAQAVVLQDVVDCSNPNFGSVKADALVGGVVQNPANYTFDWYFYDNTTNTRGSILPVANGTGQTRTGLAVGYYQAVIKDNATQCISVQTPIVQVRSLTVLPSATIAEVSPQTSCDPTKPNGVLTATGIAAGLTSPTNFTFEWYRGDNTLAANKIPIAGGPESVSGAKGETLNGVKGGGIYYTVKVITPLNCFATFKYIITENVNQPVLTLSQLTPNSVCDPAKATNQFNGSVTATVTFGASTISLPDPKYVFTWYNGPTIADPVIAVADSKNPILSGLKDGSYTATVERADIFCKSVAKTQPIAKATVIPILSATSTGSNNCNAALTPDGTATVSVTNAVGGDVFSYQWYTGNAVVPAKALGAANNGTLTTAIKLGGPVGAPNPYTVEVLNKTTGCVNNTTQFVADNSVVPVLSTSVTPNSICSPATSFSGSMTASVTNIPVGYTLADYTFKWYDGNSIAAPVDGTSTSTLLDKLDAGFYTVEGTNSKTGCKSSPATNQVLNGKIFPALVPASTGSNNCDPLMTPDGTVSYTVSNLAQHAGPFTQQWYSGAAVVVGNELPAANNGTSVTAIKVGGPTAAPKSYTVLVTNTTTGCTNFTTASVADISIVPVLSTTTNPNGICAPATSFGGSMTVAVTNIPTGYTTADYAFTWYDGNTTATLHNPQPAPSSSLLLPTLDAGTYSVKGVNTKTGCTSALATNQVSDQKKYPVIQISSTGSHNCTTGPGIVADGTATATITNSVVGETFTYLWSAVAPATALTAANNPTQSTAVQLGGPVNAPNSYNVVITNSATGCASNSTAQVADVSAKPTFTLTPFDNTVCNKTLITVGAQQYNGHVDISGVSNNAGTYAGPATLTYSWFDVAPITSALTPNASSTGTTLTQLDNGKYAAKVSITELGCVSDPIIAEVLDNVTPVVITPNVIASTNCTPALQNGKAEVTAPLGANFSYEWYNGGTVSGAIIATTPVLGTALQGTTTYTVQVTNKTDGCRGNAPMTVLDAKVIPTISLAVVSNNTKCTGTPNGELLATVLKGGVALPTPYTIAWTGAGVLAGANNEQFTQLVAGPYSAHVTETATGCQSADDNKNIIDVLTYPVISVTVTDQTTCSGTPNGKLAALGDGVANALTHDFLWKDGIGLGGATHAQSGTGIIDLLPSDDYTVQVTIKSTGCSSTQSRFVPNKVVNPSVSFIGVGPVTSCTTPNGTATASIAGLSAPTNYDIFYVFTSAFTAVAAPSVPGDIKTAVDPANHTYSSLLNQGIAPVAYGNMIPGFITAMVVDKNTLCESNPVTQQINDNTVKSNITVTLIPVPGLCGGGLGGIDPVVTPLAPAAYTYQWFVGAPTNVGAINFFNNKPTFAVAAPGIYADNGANLGVNHVPADNSISAGTYTLVVYDTDGCGTYHTDNVPTISAPNVIITPTDITRCDAPNGSLDVKVTTATPSAAGYSIEVFFGNNAGGVLKGSIPASPVNTVLSVPSLADGSYFIRVIDNAPTSIACPMGLNQVLLKKAFPPSIVVDQIQPNTSCDPSSAADGKVKLTVNNNASDALAKMYYLSNIQPSLPVGFVLNAAPGNLIGTGAAGQTTGLINGFESQTTVPDYTITVTDDNSKCSANVVVTVPDQPGVPTAMTITPTPETNCGSLLADSNGKAVASVAPATATEFDFEWYSDNALTTIVNDGIATPKPGDGSGTGGELLDRTKIVAPAVWAVGAVGQGSGDRIYYARAKKNATAATGVGCYTQVVQVIIPDQHITPDISLTPSFNSFCAAVGGLGDGKITIAADADPGTAGQQNAAGGFNYAWTNANTALASPQLAQSNNFIIPQLFTATYQVTATNATNKCAVIKSVDITPAPYIINAVASTPIDQRICNPDGQIDLASITVDRSVDPSAAGNIVETSATPLTTNYDFKWYKAAAATPGTFTIGQELKDGPTATGAIINAQSLVTGSGASVGQYALMGAGTYYVVATRKSTAAVAANCPALPLRIDIKDVHQNPVPALTALSNTSCLSLPGSDEGEITINITDATNPVFKPGAGFTYSYSWSGPAATLPANGSGNGNGANGNFVGDIDHFTQLRDNATPYTVAITNNQSGCSTNASATITKNATPVFVQSVIATDQLICGNDGSLVVTQVALNDRAGTTQVFNSASVPPIGNFVFSYDRNTIGNTVLNNSASTTLNTGNYPSIGFDSYYVVATRNTGTPGAGCKSAPFKVDILDKRIFPVATLTPFANTSCDPAFFEGEITVKVTDNSTAVGPAGFTYNWAAGNPTAIASTVASNGDATGADGDNPKLLKEGTYDMTVQSNKSLCISNATVTIFKNATPVITQQVLATDQVLCSNDGKLQVQEIKVIDRNGNVQSNTLGSFPLSDFDIEWSRTTSSNLIATGDGALGAVSGGTILDKTFYNAIGADTYFVVAKRVAGNPGKDCQSPPFKIDILNKQISPIVELTPFANTSCDPTFFEGEIEVKVTDASVNLPFVPTPFVYNYNWTTSATPAVISGILPGTSDGDQDGTDGDGDHPKLLKDGSYTLTVTNTQTGCSATGSTSIFQNSTPVIAQLVTPTDQILCNPDGKLFVNEVKVIDRNGVVKSSATGDFPISDFVFSYDRTSIGNTVLANSASNQLDNINYPTIGFDSYYVVAKRTAGGPGLNCSSAPYKVDIADQRVFPKVNFTSLANSSCNIALPNGNVTANALEQSGVNTGPYTFAWTLNNGILAPTSTQTDTNNSSVIANALDGSYGLTATNTVTGCPVTASYSLLLDQVRSTPNIIDVSTLNPLDCNPSGGAEVTKITLGSQTNSLLFPPNVSPNNDITGAGLLAFNYEWYRGSVIAGNKLAFTAPCIGSACATPTTGIAADTYYVMVKDLTTDCISSPKEVVIKDDQIIYPVVSITQTAKQISCITATGTAALLANAVEQDGSTGTYNFSWYPSLDLTGTAIAPPSATNPNTISNLLVGNYSVEVQNTVSNCKASALFIVPDDAPAFSPVVSLGGQPRLFCVGQDGSISARVADIQITYPFPYNFTADLYFGATPNLSNPPDIAGMTALPGFATSFLQAGLAEGDYTVRITDNNTSCSGVAQYTVIDGRHNPVPLIETVMPVLNCDPLRPNGVARVSADGTIIGFEFNWFEGNAAAGLPVYTGPEFGELKPALYTVEAKDVVTGCTGTVQTNFPSATVPIPIPDIQKNSDVTSCLVDNGSLSATVGADKNTRDYIFNWYNGTKENSSSDFVGDLYIDLAVGDYSVTATSRLTGCKSPLKSENIKKDQTYPDFDFQVIQPSCDQPNGSATLVLLSNVPVEKIEWENGNGPFQVGPTLNEVKAGLYTVTVTSFLGCATKKDVDIKPDIRPFNGISRNGDGRNEFFQIDCIQDFPNNIVKIFNRAGTLVFEAQGYDNSNIYFDGKSNRGISLMGISLPDGTYYYIVDKRDGSKPLAGYLEIVN